MIFKIFIRIIDIDNLSQIQANYEKMGASFYLPIEEIQNKLTEVEVLIFDWDGVFNNGFKADGRGSSFSEVDAMGTNMLRFSFWLETGKIPISIIITGGSNLYARDFSKREHFDYTLTSFVNKEEAVEKLKNEFKIDISKAAFFFDDILDIPIAKEAKLRFQIRRKNQYLFNKYLIDNKFADYASSCTGNLNAVREVSELLISCKKNFDKVIQLRSTYSSRYQEYLKQRDSISNTLILRNN